MATYITNWIDYSAGKLSASAVKAAGYTGAIRYIDAPNLLKTKHTNQAEYDDFIANGLDIQLVMEEGTGDPDGGYAAGVARAQRAKAGADFLGYGGLIYFCNDRPTLPSATDWQQYLVGAASVLGRGRVGAYGFANALNAAQNYASGFWQAGRESDLVPHADVYQWNNGRVSVSGIECDLNKVIRIYGLGGGGATSGSDYEYEEDDMPEPILMPASSGVSYKTLYFGGQFDGVLNIVPVGDVVFMGPVYTWGPGSGKDQGNGTGGGQSLVAGVNPARVEVNQPGAYRIPKGTTRVFYSYSSNQPHYACIEKVA